ncbi:hypothetical protein niasHT_029193 [Heterodera trifolii]|uniref:Biogenesis of lysosome-related organelles complex 1 subunit 1 n=1 Tax=Heterodera trifolii TaxID=157864 RepID=A0ABD2JZU4_9BILA
MLTGMVKEHMARQHLRREQQEKLKNEAIVAAHELTEALVDHLNHRVSYAYNLQKRLDVECKKLETQSAALARHADAWVALVGDMNQALKEVGDVDNWARAIEADVTQCAATLERVYRNRGGAGDGPAMGEGGNTSAPPTA